MSGRCRAKTVTKTDGSRTISYIYDASGNRTAKTVRTVNAQTNVATVTSTYYVRDAQGNVPGVYDNNNTSRVLRQSELHLYGSSRLGLFKPQGNRAAVSTNGIYTRRLGRKEYELTDHLGNVRAVIGDYRQTDGVNPVRAALRSYFNHYAFGLEMPGMNWKGNGYRYGFNGQEKSPEIDDGHTTAMYWEYDARTAMRWNTDPVVMPGLSPYATFEGNPILYSDPNGDCPTCPDGDETYRKGSTVSNKDGSWEYLGNHKWKTLSLNMGNSTAGFQSYYNQAGGASAVDAVGDQIYQGKLSAYTNNFAKGVYGQNQDGSVAVPQAIQDRLRNEANAEAFDSFKAIYAMEKSGQDPSSFNYFANPLSRAMYAGARANAVTGQGEAVGMIKGVALDVALQYVGRINFPALRPVTAHITKFIQGHTTPWAMMTKAEMKAFQHSYSRHAAELGLPNWSQSKGAGLQELFNREVTIIRNAGANGFFRSQELVNGVRITVNRTNPVINGQRYFYYETRQGKFVSAGKMP